MQCCLECVLWNESCGVVCVTSYGRGNLPQFIGRFLISGIRPADLRMVDAVRAISSAVWQAHALRFPLNTRDLGCLGATCTWVPCKSGGDNLRVTLTEIIGEQLECNLNYRNMRKVI